MTVTDPKDDAATLAMLKHMNPDHDRIWRAYDDLGRKGDSSAGDGDICLLVDDNDLGGCDMNIHPDTMITALEIGTAVGAALATFVLLMLVIGVL